MKILVTGAAGFIGYHVSNTLLSRGDCVIGLDNLNDYYEVSLKEARLEQLANLDCSNRFSFVQGDVAHQDAIDQLFASNEIDRVIHLAAQAGVRYSIENPRAYIESNVVGFMNILEACRESKVQHLVYASSSSVYGDNEKVPYSVDDNVDRPISIYAATKKSNELMAYVYSHLHGLPATGLRFFTVYGPWGRPDMSPFIFAKAIFDRTPIRLFNYGNHSRDFTYIGDIVEGVMRTFDNPPDGKKGVPHVVHNIGNNEPVPLREYVAIFERVIGKSAILDYLPKQPGDVESTFADISSLQEMHGYIPSTSLEKGIAKFVEWYRLYYGV